MAHTELLAPEKLTSLEQAMKPTSPHWALTLEPDPDAVMRVRILQPIVTHNEHVAGPGQWGLLVITVRDEAGNVVGGLWGRTGYQYLFVELLALGPARGIGLGREVMAMAEAEAIRRGLLGMWLDTWTFQAPGFYQKLGFTECGRITEYPPGHDRVFFVKTFGQAPPSASVEGDRRQSANPARTR